MSSKPLSPPLKPSIQVSREVGSAKVSLHA